MVAFTPKGGCPLKPLRCVSFVVWSERTGSIHPQGWVPVETAFGYFGYKLCDVAFTPKGGCPLKRSERVVSIKLFYFRNVAFTPKGGCPLKPDEVKRHIRVIGVMQ